MARDFSAPPRRQLNGIFWAHAASQSVPNSYGPYGGPWIMAPLRERFCLTEGGEYDAGAAIGVLFRRGGPSTVARLVVAVIVNTINRFSNRWFAHIGQKVLELLPSFADSNAAAAVSAPVSVLWVGASVAHASPARINASSIHAVLDRPMPNPIVPANESPRFAFDVASGWLRIWRNWRRLSAAALTQFDRVRISHLIPRTRLTVVRGPLLLEQLRASSF